MQYRKLGKTNLDIAEIGIGTWQLTSGGWWQGSDTNESAKALQRYIELGGNFIDTAWVYGQTNNLDEHPSEEMIGKIVKEMGNRDKIIIASKIPAQKFQWPLFHGSTLAESFPSNWIEKIVDDSLRSLQTDYIDLMQFHVWQDDFATQDEWQETIQKLTQAGKVRFWGISVNDYQPSNCLRTLDTGLISTIQFIFNIFHQKPTEKLFPYAKEHNIGLIARVPLDEGGLSGKIRTGTATNDFRDNYFGGERLTELTSHIEDLEKLLGTEAKTLPELALRYILSFAEISAVIPGMRKVTHVDSNLSVSDGRKLSPALMQELRKHAWERNFYSGHDPYLADTNWVEQ